MKSGSSKFKSLKYGLFLTFFFIICITGVASGIYSYFITANVLENKATVHNRKILVSINENLESRIKSLDFIISLVYTSDIQERLKILKKITDKDGWEYKDENTKLYMTFNNYSSLLYINNFIRHIFIITEEGDLYIESYGLFRRDYDFRNTDLYKDAMKSNGPPVFSLIFKEDYLMNQPSQTNSSDRDVKYLMIARKINDITGNDNYGVIFLTAQWKEIEKTVRNILDREMSYYYILDSDGNLIMQSNNQLSIPSEKLAQAGNTDIIEHNGEKYLISTLTSDYTGWKFISMASFKDINRDISRIKSMTLLIIFASLVLSVFISLLFSGSIMKPFQKLKTFASRIEMGDLDYRVELNSYFEFNMLAKSFNHMAFKLNDMIRHNYVLGLREKESALKALQAQMNPHFLYNTLNSISAYAQFNGVEEIQHITSALSNILRYSLQDIKDFVTLKEEITHVENYLIIQNYRYGNTINVKYNIKENVSNCKIIRFILQPLVENALLHGLETKEGPKDIIINSYNMEDNLVIEIADNGIGIPQDKLSELNTLINQPETGLINTNAGHLSIGLRNVHQRIRIIFGNPYGLKISTKPGEGTCIQVILPYNEY